MVTSKHARGSVLQVEEYSTRAIVVRGETFAHKDAFTSMGGRWNKGLKDGPGWVFSKKRADALESYLQKVNGTSKKRGKAKPVDRVRVTKPKASMGRRTLRPRKAEDKQEGDGETPRRRSREVDTSSVEEPLAARARRVTRAGSKKCVLRLRKPRRSETSCHDDDSDAYDTGEEQEDDSEGEWENEGDSSGGDDEESEFEGSEEEEFGYEGETDEEEERLVEIIKESSSRGRARKASNRSHAARGSVRVADVAEHIMSGMGYGKKRRHAHGSGTGVKKTSRIHSALIRRKRSGGGVQEDFEELLPPSRLGVEERAARQQRRITGMTPLARRKGLIALLPEIIIDHVAAYLGQKDLAHLHRSCKTMTVLLDDPMAWKNLTYLCVRHKALSTGQSKSGRRTSRPADMVVLEVMRILEEPRFKQIRGLDLTGVSLGAETPLREGPPLIGYIFETCPHVRRLRLQGPGDSSFLWSRGGVERALSLYLGEQAEELSLELDHVNALRDLLSKCKRLRALSLGGSYSRQLNDREMSRALAGGALVVPALRRLEITGQTGMTNSTLELFRQCAPRLRQICVEDCPRLSPWVAEIGEDGADEESCVSCVSSEDEMHEGSRRAGTSSPSSPAVGQPPVSSASEDEWHG